jgi:regulator of cell morphogenesis and NO signaling
MNIDFNTKTVRELALEMPQTTRVFEQLKIDYCCGGRKPISEALSTAGVAPETLTQMLDDVFNGTLPALPDDAPQLKDPSSLIDHIVNKHHIFTRSELGRLGQLMEKVAGKHGDSHPELYKMKTIFAELSDELLVHMRKEEAVLFPFIKQMQLSAEGHFPAFPPPFGTVANPVRMMMQEHDAAGDMLKELRELSGDYTLPEGACPSYTGLFFGLQELEKDLHQHIHLENNVLFDQAIELEAKVFNGTPATAGSCCGGH